MRTLLGFHVASSKRTGVVDLLKAGARCVVMVDQNMIGEARAADAITAFRTKQVKGEDNPLGIDHEALANIPARAIAWMQQIEPIWARNLGATYYLPNCEWDIGDLDAGAKINSFAIECMKYGESRGYRLGILNFATGNPNDNPIAGAPCSMEQRLDTVLPALRYCQQHGHMVSLHIHGDLLRGDETIALRFNRLLRYCSARGFLPQVMITELSNGVGGIEPNLTEYLAAIAAWDKAARASPFVGQLLGAALYGFNAAETLRGGVPQIAAVMRAASDQDTPPAPTTISFRGEIARDQYAALAAFVTSRGGKIEANP